MDLLYAIVLGILILAGASAVIVVIGVLTSILTILWVPLLVIGGIYVLIKLFREEDEDETKDDDKRSNGS
jgi:4-hydroxybenzoate polyprenyltransferase